MKIRICSTCKSEKPESDFKIHGYRCIDCKELNRKNRNERYKKEGQSRKYKTDHYHRHKNEPRYWIIERISQYHKKDPKIPVSNLTVEYLMSLLEKQQHKCYYSNEPIFFGIDRGHALSNSASLDRLVPEKGYTIGNVVWCSYRLNTMKSNLSEDKFYALMQDVLSIQKIRREKCNS
jgi:hypothetical protein